MDPAVNVLRTSGRKESVYFGMGICSHNLNPITREPNIPYVRIQWLKIAGDNNFKINNSQQNAIIIFSGMGKLRK